MATRNRFLLIGAGVLLLLFIIVVALVSIPRLLHPDSFRGHIESALSGALGRKVTLGKLDFSLWSGSLVAQNVVVADDPAFSSQPFLRVSLLKIRVEVFPLILSHDVHIEGFELIAPQIALLRAADGTWNYASLGHAGATQSVQTQTGSIVPNFTAGHVDVSNGTLNVGSGLGAGVSAAGTPNHVYNGLSVDVKNFSFKKSFPFTVSARLPNAGSVSIRGAAGPINPRDASLTPFTAHAEVTHLDLAAAGVLDAGGGLSGLVDRISIDAAWSGGRLHVAKLIVDSPQFSIVHAATAAAPEAAPAGNGMIAMLSVDSLVVINGVITVAGQPAGTAIYRQVNLAVSNYSPKTSSPFTLSAQLPGGGTLNASGNAGPFNRQDATATPIDAEISLKHADLAASGFSGIGGFLNLDARAASDGHTLNANGVVHAEGLQLAKSGSPSPQPVDVRFAATQNMQSHAGQLEHSTVTIGSAVINVAGAYQYSGAATEVSLKVDAPSIPVDQIQAFLPSLGIKLPSGSRLQGGTLTASLNITGPIGNPVISGPLRLDDTQLAGFDLGSQLSSILGAHPGSGTDIRSLSLNLHIANGSMQTDNVVLVVPALGSATGSGTVSASGALDYHMILKPAALSGGAAGAGGIASQLMGMIPGGAGTPIGGLAALKNGIPVAIGGTTSKPTFTPNLGAGRNAPSSGNSLGNALGGLLSGHH